MSILSPQKHAFYSVQSRNKNCFLRVIPSNDNLSHVSTGKHSDISSRTYSDMFICHFICPSIPHSTWHIYIYIYSIWFHYNIILLYNLFDIYSDIWRDIFLAFYLTCNLTLYLAYLPYLSYPPLPHSKIISKIVFRGLIVSLLVIRYMMKNCWR